MTWLTLQIFSLGLNSANSILDKRLVRDYEANPVVYMASFAMVGFPVAFVGVFSVPWMGLRPAGVGLLTGLLFTGMVLLYYKAMSLGDVSQLIPILRLSSVWNLFFLAICLNDKLSIGQYMASGCILLGTVALSWKKRGKDGGENKNKGVVLMLIVAFLAAVKSLLASYVTLTYSPFILLVWSQLGNVLGMGVVLMFQQQRVALRQSLATTPHRFKACIVGEQVLRLITTVLSDLAVVEAGSAAIVAVVGGLRPFIVLVLAMIFLQERFERDEWFPKLVGIGCMVGGTGLFMVAT